MPTPSIEIRRARYGSYRLECNLWLPRPIEAAFEFFADAFNLEAITPPWLRFRVLTPEPVSMAAGTRLSYRLQLHGIPVRWESEITDWNPPHRFVDEHGLAAMNYQISLMIYFPAAYLSIVIFIGILLVPALMIAHIVVIIMGALKAQRGEPWEYPFAMNFLK